MISFDDVYGAGEGYFGEWPERTLVTHLADLDKSRPVLDIGCGQGRHALYLADHGFTVDALDPSGVAADQVACAAADRGLPVRTIHGTFQDLATSDGTYGAILVFGLVPVLGRPEINALAAIVTSALAPRGFLFITAFGTWDPAYPRHASEWHEVGANSFRGPGGDLRTYLEPGELMGFFPDFDVVHSWEGLGPEHRHGAGSVERHGLAEAVLRR
jgi:cyclopropane fatty-acyl-phospholipid synthase-like methyltransferase